MFYRFSLYFLKKINYILIMILGKPSLSNRIKNENLIDNYAEDNIKSASYDLRIGTIYKEKKIYSENYNF